MDDDEKGSEQRGTKGDNLKHPHHLQPVSSNYVDLGTNSIDTSSPYPLVKPLDHNINVLDDILRIFEM